MNSNKLFHECRYEFSDENILSQSLKLSKYLHPGSILGRYCCVVLEKNDSRSQNSSASPATKGLTCSPKALVNATIALCPVQWLKYISSG